MNEIKPTNKPEGGCMKFYFHTKWTLCICYLVITAVLAQFSTMEKQNCRQHKSLWPSKLFLCVQHIYCWPLEGSGKPQSCLFTTLKTYALSDFLGLLCLKDTFSDFNLFRDFYKSLQLLLTCVCVCVCVFCRTGQALCHQKYPSPKCWLNNRRRHLECDQNHVLFQECRKWEFWKRKNKILLTWNC